jgi:hypothetical protein
VGVIGKRSVATAPFIHKTKRADCIEESQAMRYIVPVISSGSSEAFAWH